MPVDRRRGGEPLGALADRRYLLVAEYERAPWAARLKLRGDLERPDRP
jgi:hypothetical protein